MSAAVDLTSGATLKLPPLSLYIHVPWCVRKCPYCDFNSHTEPDELPEQAYLAALLEDLDSELPAVVGRELVSIFIGGGTPSLMSGEFYRQLLSAARERIPFSDRIEITLEANPGTFEQARFAAFREAGINRLSIGVQSFADTQLQALGRIHSAANAVTAVAAARDIGFQRINIDLMHGLPGQGEAEALADLQQAVALAPGHISWYQLTIEANTLFYSQPPRLPEDDTLWSIQERGQAYLASAGYVQYEISAYGQQGDQSRHNLNYWQFGDYIGIGAGAHGKLTEAETSTIRRRWKLRQPKAYMMQPRISNGEILELSALPLEFMMNALRLRQGVPSRLFSERTGLPLQQIAEPLARAVELGLLTADTGERLQPSERGYLFLNELLALFYPAD